MRKPKANDEEEWIPDLLKKIENSSTEECTISCSNSNENLTRFIHISLWKFC